MTLEHTPPRSLKKGLNVRSVPLCLTCAHCNNTAGRRIDQAASIALKPPKAHVKICGVSHVGSFLGREDGRNIIEMKSRPRVPLGQGLKTDELEVTLKLVKPRFVAVSWLKSAYLSVFSRLGEHGYRYAKGEAIRQVREQIMNPGKEIIKNIFVGGPGEPQGDWLYMSRGPELQCYVVSFGSVTVLLPPAWDTSFFENLGENWNDPFDFSDGIFWKRSRFGWNIVASFSVAKEHPPEKTLGPSPFGRDIRVVENGRNRDYVVADIRGLDVTLLPAKTA